MAIVIFAGIFVGTIGLKQVNPFLASITGISVPVLTVFAASFVFRDKLNLFHLFSLLLMIIGGLALL
jgi:drug/metabolite transporter (DMT)-like permease